MLHILPLLHGWNLMRITDSKELQAGKYSTLYESSDDEKGWILGAIFSSNEPNASLEIIYDATKSGQTISFTLKPSLLHSVHRIAPNGLSPYLAIYDDANNIYEAIFAPTTPFPFDGTLTITAIGGVNDSNVYFDVQFIVITDESAFIDSLRQLIGVSDIEKYLYNALRQLGRLSNGTTIVDASAPTIENPMTPSIGLSPQNKYFGFLP